jgi:rhodanese-related sulfurtransferase
MKYLFTVIALSALVALIPLQLNAAGVKSMDSDGLKSMLSSPELVVLDVRTGTDWSESEFKIKGAIRVDPGKVASWAQSYAKDKIYVLYCA